MHPSGFHSRRTVLVVDDDPLALELFSLVLRDGGYEVITADSAIGVSQLIAERRPHAMIVDLHMPAMHGDRLIRLVRARQGTAELPVILTSGDARSDLEKAAATLPGIEILPKADVRERLVPLLRRLVRAADHSRPFTTHR